MAALDMYKNLLKEYRSGKRWVVYHPEGVECFFDFGDAADLCHCFSFSGHKLFVKILSAELRRLNQTATRAYTKKDVACLKRQLLSYNINLLVGFHEAVFRLLNYEYIPILWVKEVNLLTVIQVYYVVLNNSETIAYSVYWEALASFNTFARKAACSVVLMGYFKAILKGKKTALPKKGEGLVLYRYVKLRGVFQVNDPCKTLVLQMFNLVQYHSQSKSLRFFDSKLKKRRPGEISGFPQCQYFSM